MHSIFAFTGSLEYYITKKSPTAAEAEIFFLLVGWKAK